MGISFAAASEVEEAGHFKLLVYGFSGAGKTHLVSQCEDAVVLLFEPQGFNTVRRSNPGAIMVQNADGEPYIRDMNDFRRIMHSLMTGELAEEVKKATGQEVKTIVIDSLTELQQVIRADIERGRKPGSTFTMQDWGELGKRVRSVLAMLRDLKYNVVVTALVEDRESEETNTVRKIPLLEGGARRFVNQHFNAVGYAYRSIVEVSDEFPEGVRNLVLFSGDDEHFATKSYGALSGAVDPHVNLWFEAIRDLDNEEEWRERLQAKQALKPGEKIDDDGF